MTTHVVRSKPDWLSLYGFYLFGALLMCGLAMVRWADQSGVIAASMYIPTAGVFGFAMYSLLHWRVHWARSFNLGLNIAVALVGLLYMTPIASTLPWFFHMLYGFIMVPVFAGMPAESLQSMTPMYSGLIGLALVSFAVYWTLCWAKFVPAADGSVADLESEELSRNVRSVIRKGIIALWLVGFLALFKAVFDFDDGNSKTWSAIAAASLFLAVIAMLLTRLFPGEQTLSPEEVEELLENELGRAAGTHESNQYSQAEASADALTIEANPLADDVLNPDETHRVEKMSKQAKRPKGNIFNKDVTGIAFILFGIPVLLVVVFVAMMVTIMGGGGFGTFLVMLLFFGIAFVLNVIKG